ncbi:hypothetical protein FKM82_004674 [Ascaphus truei]
MGYRFYVRQAEKVIDGTPCDQNGTAICVSGQCKSAKNILEGAPPSDWDNSRCPKDRRALPDEGGGVEGGYVAFLCRARLNNRGTCPLPLCRRALTPWRFHVGWRAMKDHKKMTYK